ncbi:MAG: Gfo/Idh/MocA family oxidoreductase [Verrucomicrobia bacterium]|nr:Gfo/Idh/MocA family oxidoreductase [Verrucomicrobiota bacterium]
MHEPLRVGIVGGGIGRSHAKAYQALRSDYDLRVLCDLDATRAADVATEADIPETMSDFAELCGRDDIDLIDVCTPSHLHAPMTKAALMAGKHVFCEKPHAASLRDIDELQAIERKADRRVMPIFQYRFGHGLQKLKALVDAGLAGAPYLATVETLWRRRSAYYEVSWRGTWKGELGGVFVTHAIHAHDALNYIFGPTQSVFARASTRVNPIEVEDCGTASLTMANGALATLSATLGSANETSRHRFVFGKLTAESNQNTYTNSSDPWTFVGDTADDDKQIQACLAEFQPQPEGFEGQFRRFAAALRHEAPAPVTLTDARNSIELITALYHSIQTGQAVDLPLTAEHPAYNGWLPTTG